MKELTIEQKAKRYDSMFERLKEMYNNNKTNVAARLICERYFPELKESEEEKIRKALIEACKQSLIVGGFHKDKVIAWLEKQDNLMKALQISNARIGELIEKNHYLKEQFEKQSEHTNFLNKIQIGDKVTRNEDGVLVNLSQLNRVAKKDEKQGENNMGISEATKQKLEDNLNKALEKETPESWNKFLDEQGEQKPAEWSEEDEVFYNRTIGLLEQYNNSDSEVEKQSALSCVNWLKSVIKHEKIIKYKIGDKVRFFSHDSVFTISDIDETNERYISKSGDSISFYEELILVKSSINKDDIKCGDYLTTEDGTVIKVHDVDEIERVHHFYYASVMTEEGGNISNNFMHYCAILSDCRRATQEEIDFLEKWVAHKKYVWDKNNATIDEDD